ncbi:MAG: 4Fe-4S binding protein [Spirochaetes bacterium]|nr:4Fe-4S binding protein [Spirochaetota bacterium]
MKSKNVLLIFNKKIMYKPLIYRLAKDFDVVFNVLEAKILPKLEGRLILELRGEEDSVDSSIDYLMQEGVVVETLVDRIVRDDERCIHCGACTSVCRVDALCIDRSTMKVMFDHEKCVACGMCKIACPVGAMSGASIDLD